MTEAVIEHFTSSVQVSSEETYAIVEVGPGVPVTITANLAGETTAAPASSSAELRKTFVVDLEAGVPLPIAFTEVVTVTDAMIRDENGNRTLLSTQIVGNVVTICSNSNKSNVQVTLEGIT